MKKNNDRNKESTLGQGAILFTAPTTGAGLCYNISSIVQFIEVFGQ